MLNMNLSDWLLWAFVLLAAVILLSGFFTRQHDRYAETLRDFTKRNRADSGRDGPARDS